ncbi:CPBP family glutamic-type intramembrane protease [Rhodohalobacter sp. 8-1]|uniref:CPBP family glutamic-type intramembrane protease n=1 Tax=Rhodohalobacter sp. 8-1 TaxID=3131972 RepID=UPI0030ED8557
MAEVTLYPVKTYFRQTRGLYYSYIFALPLFILYEIFIRFSQVGSEQVVRISVDIWFQTLFSFFGFDALTATLGIALLVGAIIIFTHRKNLPALRLRFFGWLLVESVLYAILFSLLISQFLELILQMDLQNKTASLSKFQLFSLSLGAGLYEELFFRVFLVSALFYGAQYIFTAKRTAYIISAIVAAVAFSGVHYVGEFADAWSFGSFLFRFLFGLTLNVIYVVRGFGCTAWTHALYDLIVVFKI